MIMLIVVIAMGKFYGMGKIHGKRMGIGKNLWGRGRDGCGLFNQVGD